MSDQNSTVAAATTKVEEYSQPGHTDDMNLLAFQLHGENGLGRTFEVRTGDTFVVRGGVPHGAAAIEDSQVIDVFPPCRMTT